jgi:hypothetical protein
MLGGVVSMALDAVVGIVGGALVLAAVLAFGAVRKRMNKGEAA